MSIQDESFPVDEFLDELDFSPLAVGQRFQFPNHQRKQKKQEQQQQQQQQHESKVTTTIATTTSSSSEQNLSTESQNERPPSCLSSKTSASASDADDNSSKNPEFSNNNRQQSKAVSYQDIHSEYTKRRFKHVASKVGLYIANMKADEQKRREAKFERHRSMPDTLSGSDVLLNEGDQKHSTLRFSVDELNRKLNLNLSNSDGDGDGDVESATNTSTTNTSVTNTSATTSASAATTTNNNSDGRHETSDNVSGGNIAISPCVHITSVMCLYVNIAISPPLTLSLVSWRPSELLLVVVAADALVVADVLVTDVLVVDVLVADSTSPFVDKKTFALLLHEKERIQSYSEYLQTKLDEKSSESMRLKRYFDYMRIELTNCQDKLKEKEKASAKSRLPLFFTQAKFSKATQTDIKTPSPLLPPRNLYITPDTPDANNNNAMCDASTGNASKPGKNVATIQPLSLNFSNIAEHDSANGSGGVLRQRTNSNTVTQHKPSHNGCALTNKNNNINTNNNNNHNSRSSSDSAIDIESVELSSSSKIKLKLQHKNSRNTKAANVAHTTQSLGRAEEFIYYDKRSGRYATLQALNVGDTATTAAAAEDYDENNETTQTNESTRGSNDSRKTKKHHSLRRRWLRIFGHCARCSDPHALDNSALQQTYTQIPPLEKSMRITAVIYAKCRVD